MDEFDSIIFDLAPRFDDDDKESIQYLSSEDKLKSESFDGENIPERGGRLLERARPAVSLSFSLSDFPVIQNPFSQYKTPPPVISPKSLLDSSPSFLSNAMVQPSPTTGKVPFLWNKSCTFDFGADDSASFFEDLGSSPFESKPIEDSGSPFFPEDTSLVPMEFPVATSDNRAIEAFNDDRILGGVSNSLPPLDDDDHHQQKDEEEQRNGGDVMMNAAGDDGYNWRKYGQKHVKCSDYPRSYYKCTHPNCPVKKKVERSYEGHITEIIYEKSHNHPGPAPNRRSNHPTEVQLDPQDQNRGGDAAQINGLANNFPNIDEEEDHNQHEGGAGVLGYQGEECEHESKRRKIEASYPPEQMSGATRAMKEPRVVVQTLSEIDILEDGFRWRKYGQKVVKGNPNPRSYYKCTSASCPVRKHVERASQDLRSVITTYEGKHNHPVPAARNSNNNNNNNNNNSNHVNSANQAVGHPASISTQSHQHHLLHRVDPFQVQNELSRFNRPYGMTGRQFIGGHPNGFTSFGMNQQGLGTNLGGMMGMGMGGMNMNMGGMSMSMNMGIGMDMGLGMNMGMGMGTIDMGMGIGSMGGLGSGNQANMPVLPAMPSYLGQQSQMGLMIPKGEPISESSINNIVINNNNNNNHHKNNNNNNMANGSPPSSASSASSVYHQILNLPVGPQI